MLTHIQKNFSKTFVLIFGGMLLLSSLIIWAIQNNEQRINENRMQYFAVSKSNQIIEAVIGLLYKAEALSALVIQGNGEITDFEKIAALLINDPAIKNVLLAPNGVISRVYPPNENQGVIGHDLFGEGQGNSEAILAKEIGQLTMGGPFDLVQGGQALVGRVPVYMHNKQGHKTFWGIVSVTLRYPQILAKVYLEDIVKLGFVSQIWRISPDTNEKQIILNSGNGELENPVERNFKLLNADWIISIANTNEWYENISFWLYVFAALLISFMVAMLGQNFYDTKKMKRIMESMAMLDPLTNLPNRRAFFQTMREKLRTYAESKQSFALCYVDLDDFKQINDTYGHQIGDHVLIETATRLKKSIGDEQFVARIGGDEFIVIVTFDHTQDTAASIHQLLHTNIKKCFQFTNTICKEFSASIGIAIFPDNGKTIDELTLYADESMYKTKRHFRSLDRAHSI